MSFTIEQVDLNVTREPLTRPLGFKGGYFTEKWIAHVTLTDDRGNQATSLGGFAVLWSDAAVFSAHTEVGGNVAMCALLEHALQLARGRTYETPIDLLGDLFEPVHAFGCRITGRADLRPTFTLNALVALDHAAWLLHAKRNGITSFDELIPPTYRPALAHRHEALARIPLVSYQVPLDEIVQLVAAGHSILKIKIGAPGNPEAMLAADKQRIAAIHQAVGGRRAGPDGHAVRYYLDANGRYPDKPLLRELLTYADKIGMSERIIILEEPFDEACSEPVGDLGVTVAADESLHDPADVARRIDLGYGCLALKPAGKSLSMTLLMAAEAHLRDVPCFVADSACTPRMLDCNRQVAARLAPFPGLEVGLLESNGAQHYRHWQALLDAHPDAGAPWLSPRNGLICLPEAFYAHGSML